MMELLSWTITPKYDLLWKDFLFGKSTDFIELDIRKTEELSHVCKYYVNCNMLNDIRMNCLYGRKFM